ncbi:hypothetical protein ES703_122913 [subsurface metagenome]
MEFDSQVLFKKKVTDAYFCYYSQYLPTIVNKLTSLDIEDKLISPLIHFNQDCLEEIATALHEELAGKFSDLDPDERGDQFIFDIERC